MTIYNNNKTSHNQSKSSIAYMFNDQSVVNIPIRKDEEQVRSNSTSSSEKIRNMIHQVNKQGSHATYSREYQPKTPVNLELQISSNAKSSKPRRNISTYVATQMQKP